MTLTGAVMLGILAALALIWTVGKYITPAHQGRGYIVVVVLTGLYMLGIFALLERN